MNRRDFIKFSGLATLPFISPRLAFAAGQGASQADVLVCVFQRGAADGLNLIVPHGDQNYYLNRPNIAIPQPGQTGGAIDLDGFFGLNPNMAALKPIYDAGDLSLVHACGSPDPSRSHFEAQDFMEFGTPGVNTTADGWLNRYLAGQGLSATFQGVGMGRVPLALQGLQPVVGMNSIAGYDLNTHEDTQAALRQAIVELYGENQDIDVVTAGILASVDELKTADPGSLTPDHGAIYPGSPFAGDLQQVAQLIKSDIGLRVACVDTGGWDHHNQLEAALSPLSADFANSLAAFHQDLGSQMSRVHVLVMTEFGRRVRENASLGTDHGHGGVMFVLSGATHGGQIHGQWPGLAPADLFDGDLAITTDYRTVLSELLIKRMGVNEVSAIFPEFTGPMDAGVFMT